MSKLSSAHYEIARWIRWRVGDNDDVEVNSDVQHYHRADQYREIYIGSPNIHLIDDLYPRIVDHVKRYDNPRLRITVNAPARTAKPKFFVLHISIWLQNPS